SSDPKFAEKVQRLIRPEALKQKKPWMWSPGIGADVWEMFCACITGDLESVKRLLDKDPSLARSHYEYRTPLSFAVRENHVEVATFLLDHGADPLALGDVLQVARPRVCRDGEDAGGQIRQPAWGLFEGRSRSGGDSRTRS